MRRRTLLSIIALFYGLALVTASGLTVAYSNGVPDQNFEYDCAGSCHADAGSGTITATASTLTPTTGQPMTVTVSVTTSQLGGANEIGVFLLRSFDTSNSRPNVDGWTILSDPNGGNFNYVEKVAAGVGVQTDFTWSLNAPSTVGTYKLYARAHHGEGTALALYLDYTAGLTFDVRAPVAGEPEISHQPPQNIRPNAQILINATIVNGTSAVLSWKNDSMTNYIDVTMTNTSTAQGAGWLYQAIIPAQPTAIQISYSINATGPGGSVLATYSLAVTTVAPPTGITDEEQIVWTLTVVATILVTLAILSMVYVLFAQKLRSEEQPPQEKE